MKAYLSGPMSGIPEYNFPAFKKATMHLRNFKWSIVDPTELQPRTDLPLEEYMRADLAAICQCDAIILLDDWEKSQGCRYEINVAKACGLKFYRYNDGTPVEFDIDKAGRKFDDDKLQWGKMRWRELALVMDVLQFGANKYGWDNFEHVAGAEERYKDALLRHIIAYISGEENDQESGRHHLAHAGCNMLFLLYFSMNKKK